MKYVGLCPSPARIYRAYRPLAQTFLPELMMIGKMISIAKSGDQRSAKEEKIKRSMKNECL